MAWTFNPFTGTLQQIFKKLSQLLDMAITSATKWDVLQFNGTKWVNKQDVEVKGTGHIYLKSGQKLFFDGSDT